MVTETERRVHEHSQSYSGLAGIERVKDSVEGEPCQSLVNLGDMLRCHTGKGKEQGFVVTISL